MNLLRLNLVFAFILIIGFTSFGQNKTLGVGTVTPNPNAALHVESPTSNQGMIMPRLTTVQRTAMTLAAIDEGLMVFDTDLKTNYVWNGSAWGTALTLPADITLNTADLASVTDALKITYNGDDARGLLSVNFTNAANANTINPFSVTHAGQGAATVVTQSGTLGTGGIYQLTNPVNSNNAFRASTLGTGIAGNFVINNAANSSAALKSATNGTGYGLEVQSTGTGDNAFFNVNNPTSSGSPVVAITNGVGLAGFFQTNNAAAGTSSLMATNNSNLGGVTPPVAIFGNATGTGVSAGSFRINNAGNPYSALFTETTGTGMAVNANIVNAASTSPVIYANHAGNGFGVHAVANTTTFGGSAVYGEQLGTGDASGAFRINNTANNFAALYGETNGAGAGSSAVRGLNTGGGNGAYFRKDGANAGTAAMWAENYGSDGYAAVIQSIDVTNPKAALFAEAVGPGASIWANKDPGESGTSLEARHSGTTGSAGTFDILEVTNTSPAITASHAGDGHAIAIGLGGLKVSTFTIVGGGSIANRATAYSIDANTYTFPGGFLTEGDTFYFFNTGAGPATIDGLTIAAGSGRVFIVIGGVLRGF